jgi:hypothetical protein
MTSALEQYFHTKKVTLTLPGMVAAGGPNRTYDNLDDLVKDVENARVWGGLHFRTTMEETARYFPRIAKDIGKEYFLKGKK